MVGCRCAKCRCARGDPGRRDGLVQYGVSRGAPARCAIDDWVERGHDLPKVLLPYKAGMVNALISFRLEG